MLDLTKPVRTKVYDGLKVKIVGVFKSREHRNREMLFIVTTTPDGTSYFAYRNPDGTHSNGMSNYDLVNIDAASIASAYQTMDPEPANALRVLWKHEQFGPVIDVMLGLEPALNRDDIQHYFEGLWG